MARWPCTMCWNSIRATGLATVYERVKTHLEHQVVHECGCCQCSDLKPLHMFVSGVGGTGKSFLIKTIRALAACAVTAPKGLAAFNVDAVIHRAQSTRAGRPGTRDWGKDALKVMRTSLSKLKLLIIDEVSMVSWRTLDEIFARDQWFGGVNILFVNSHLSTEPPCLSVSANTLHYHPCLVPRAIQTILFCPSVSYISSSFAVV